MDYPGEPVPES